MDLGAEAPVAAADPDAIVEDVNAAAQPAPALAEAAEAEAATPFHERAVTAQRLDDWMADKPFLPEEERALLRVRFASGPLYEGDLEAVLGAANNAYAFAAEAAQWGEDQHGELPDDEAPLADPEGNGGVAELLDAQAEGPNLQPAPLQDQIDGAEIRCRRLLRHPLVWWRARMLQPIEPGSTTSILQACYSMAEMKTDLRGSNEIINRMCRLNAGLFMTDGNMFPPSYYIIRGILGCADASRYERHICSNSTCCFVFPDLPDRASWAQHAADECVHCGTRRFKQHNNSVTPVKRLWDLGVKQQIESLFLDEVFANSFGRSDAGGLLSETMQDPSTYLGSPAGRMLDQACGQCFSKNEHAGLYTIGADGVQIFSHITHSTYVVILRPLSLPLSLSAKRRFSKVLLIFEGPHEPANIDYALQPTVDYFVKHNPGLPEPHRTPHTLKDVFFKQIVPHWPVLAFLSADTPAMAVLAKTSGHSAKAACVKCSLKGRTDGLGSNTVRFLSYAAPFESFVQCVEGAPPPNAPPAADGAVAAQANAVAAAAGGQHGNAPVKSYAAGLLEPDCSAPRLSWHLEKLTLSPTTWATDNTLKWSEKEMAARARLGDEIRRQAQIEAPTDGLAGAAKTERFTAQQELMQAPHRKLGCRGTPIWAQLPYHRFLHFYPLPIAHLILNGVLKNWLDRMFAAPSVTVALGNDVRFPKLCRAAIVQSGSQILTTGDFKKRYTCVVSKRGSWTMEDSMAFVETYSPIVFHDLPWGDSPRERAVRTIIERQWKHLRAACLYFLRYRDGQHTDEALQLALDHALKYATSAEKVFEASALTTFKLHQLVIHLSDQAKAQGATANMMEYWVERVMQLVKRMVKYRMTAHPELLFFNDWLLQDASRLMREAHPPHCRAFLEIFPEYQKRALSAANHDVTRDDLGVQLLDAAKEVSGDEEKKMLDWLAQDMAENSHVYENRGWHGCSENVDENHELLQGVVLSKHHRAVLASDDVLTSTQVNHERKKDSTWAAILFDANTPNELSCVARMNYFISVAMPDLPTASLLKLAVTDMYACEVVKDASLETRWPAAAAAGPADVGRGHRASVAVVPDLLKTEDGAACWLGEIAHLATFTTQLVPTQRIVREHAGVAYRLFGTANKASGRNFKD